jgi:hypothetical protein
MFTGDKHYILMNITDRVVSPTQNKDTDEIKSNLYPESFVFLIQVIFHGTLFQTIFQIDASE